MLAIAHSRDTSGLGFQPEGTIILDLPSIEVLNNLFQTHSTALLVMMGVARCHPKDQFVKKTGRELAQTRMLQSIAEFSNVQVRGTKHVYHFNCTTGKNKVSFGLSTIAESKQVCLIYAKLDNNL